MNSAANGTPAFAVHDAIALDGDKLKPRVDQRKGGNGGANSTEGVAPTVLSDSHGTPHGAGYTLTGVDRHGVAYGVNNQGGAAPQFTDETSGTMVAASNSSGNNLHGVAYKAKRTWWNGADVATTTTTTGHNQLMPDKDRFDSLKHSEVCRTLTGNHDDRVTDTGTSVVVSTAYKLDSTASNSMKSANPHSGFHETQVAACLDTTTPDPSKGQGGNVIISTNSNGEDIAPTISSCEYKMGQKQKDTGGGGYVVSRIAKEGAEGE